MPHLSSGLLDTVIEEKCLQSPTWVLHRYSVPTALAVWDPTLTTSSPWKWVSSNTRLLEMETWAFVQGLEGQGRRRKEIEKKVGKMLSLRCRDPFQRAWLPVSKTSRSLFRCQHYLLSLLLFFSCRLRRFQHIFLHFLPFWLKQFILPILNQCREVYSLSLGSKTKQNKKIISSFNSLHKTWKKVLKKYE